MRKGWISHLTLRHKHQKETVLLSELKTADPEIHSVNCDGEVSASHHWDKSWDNHFTSRRACIDLPSWSWRSQLLGLCRWDMYVWWRTSGEGLPIHNVWETEGKSGFRGPLQGGHPQWPGSSSQLLKVLPAPITLWAHERGFNIQILGGLIIKL